jgi:leader peptidase (prepilin peptidase)/N-methyltransferase
VPPSAGWRIGALSGLRLGPLIYSGKIMTVELAITFILGLIIGSFLNVVIFRIDNLQTILLTRSKCPNCGKQLQWFDLVPLLSFIMLKGKCRYCQKPISVQYPIVELGTAIMVSSLFLHFGLGLAFFYYSLIFCILAVVLVYDFYKQLVPEEFVWAALILTIILSWYIGGLGIGNMFLGGLVGGGFPALLVMLSKEKWMGAGDIKIGLILGMLLGYPVAIFGLFLAFVLGSVVGIAFIAKSKKTLKDSLPFTPFLIAATFLGLIYGNLIVNWYLYSINF